MLVFLYVSAIADYVILLRIVLSLNHEESKLETVESVLTKSELPFVMHNCLFFHF